MTFIPEPKLDPDMETVRDLQEYNAMIAQIESNRNVDLDLVEEVVDDIFPFVSPTWRDKIVAVLALDLNIHGIRV